MPVVSRALLLPVSILLLTACPSGGESTGPEPTPTPTPTPVITAASTGGASQSKTVNAPSDVMTATFLRDGAPLAGASVTWTTTGGTLAVSTTTTNAQGQATNTLTTVGAAAGSVTVTASASGRSTTFSIAVNAQPAGPPASIAFPARVLALDSAGTKQMEAVVKDANGTTLTGQTITYTSRATGVATVNSAGIVSGVASGSAVIVASITGGTTTYRDSMVALVGRPDGPVVYLELPRFDLKTDTTITAIVVADMRGSTTKLGSGKVVVNWNNGLLAYQGHAEGSSNVGATVNANNTGTGSLTLAFASSGGYSGRVELRRITFKVTSAAGSAGTVAASAGEAYAAGSYTNLMPKTVSAVLPFVTR